MNILITGITTGFGFLTAKKLLANGHTLLSPVRGGWARIENDLDFSSAKKSGRLHVIDLDLVDASRYTELKVYVETKLNSKLDVLIHNAGLGILMPFELQNSKDIRQQFDVNFFAPLELTRILLPHLRFSKGKIICVSSVAGLISIPFYSTYCASKFALEAWLESLSSELATQKVKTFLVEPGGYSTEFATHSASKLKFQIPSDLKDVYHSMFSGFQNIMTKKAKAGQNPIHVANRIVQLAEGHKTGFRNIMGIDAKLGFLLSRILPREVFRRTIGFLFRLITDRFATRNESVSE